METILFLSHTEADGSLAKVALEGLTGAVELQKSCGASLHVALFGKSTDAALQMIAGCGGSRFLAVDGEEFSEARYGSDAATCEALCRVSGASIVVAPQTSRMARVMAGVAHRLGGEIDTHVARLDGSSGVSVNRCFYRQRVEAVLSRAKRPWVILVEPGSYSAWDGQAASVAVESVSVSLGESARRTSVTGVIKPPEDQQTIRPDAKLLFVAGAGWTKRQKDGQTHLADAEAAILGFLKNSQASLGGSKSLVDQSGEGQAVLKFMTHLNQVGQTGATPRHPKGLSTCCHGEEPHVVGWRFITERRAINLDANCGWARGKADVLYVADAFEVMTKVNRLLAEKTEKQVAAVHA